jgi:Flp pilus assembly protein TadG
MRPYARDRSPNGERRSGATLVEMAVVVPVFAVFLAALMEFGHAFLVVGTLNAAAKQAARYGAVEGITTADVEDRVEETVGSAFDSAMTTVYVKDASVFDSASPPTTIDYTELPDIELSGAERRQLYVVRVEVNYNDVALMPPFWAKDLKLYGQSVMRHE